MKSSWYRVLFEEMPCLGAFACAVAAFVLIFAAFAIHARLKERRDAPHRALRERNDKAAHQALAELGLDWFAVSSTIEGSHVDISYLSDIHSPDAVRQTVIAALTTAAPGVTLEVRPISEVTPQSFPGASNHLMMFLAMSAPSRSEET